MPVREVGVGRVELSSLAIFVKQFAFKSYIANCPNRLASLLWVIISNMKNTNLIYYISFSILITKLLLF